MNQYVSGAMIKSLRKNKKITQCKLASKLGVSDKTISKWESGRGYPDISLIKPLADALGVSVIELFSGASVVNTNKAFDMRRSMLYVCPVCGNIIQSTGEAVISCCGIVLPAAQAEPANNTHNINIRQIEDEYYVTIPHEMAKTHYISFIMAIRDDGCEIKKLYPESNAEAHFKISKTRYILCFCNRHGLFKASVL